jgi:enoyl-CoA hydratase
MEAAFAWHHFAHVHNEQISGDLLGGYDAKGMVKANKAEAAGNGAKSSGDKA